MAALDRDALRKFEVSIKGSGKGWMTSRSRGFTLLELTIVIAIVGLIMGGLLMPLAAQLEGLKYRETERRLRDVKQALEGYAVINGRLPCPDILGHPDEIGGQALDGREDCELVEAGADTAEGLLPWRELDVSPADAWGNVFRYGVTEEFVRPVRLGAGCSDDRLDLCDPGQVQLYTRGDDLSTVARENKARIFLVTGAPAIVLSAGPNGIGARPVDGPLRSPVQGSPGDEAENYDQDGLFAVRTRTLGGADCDDETEGRAFCPFDDLAVWLSRPVLIGELIDAGQLP